MECPMGNSENFRLHPEVFPNKNVGKYGEKKGAENYLPYTYGDATSGDVISGEVTINLAIHLKY